VPEEPSDGICFNVLRRLRAAGYTGTVGDLYDYLGRQFEAMGLDASDPLGDWNRIPLDEMWVGKRGERRRTLASRLATQLRGKRLERMGYDLDELDRDNPYNP
jgi:hypothetical protein